MKLTSWRFPKRTSLGLGTETMPGDGPQSACCGRPDSPRIWFRGSISILVETTGEPVGEEGTFGASIFRLESTHAWWGSNVRSPSSVMAGIVPIPKDINAYRASTAVPIISKIGKGDSVHIWVVAFDTKTTESHTIYAPRTYHDGTVNASAYFCWWQILQDWLLPWNTFGRNKCDLPRLELASIPKYYSFSTRHQDQFLGVVSWRWQTRSHLPNIRRQHHAFEFPPILTLQTKSKKRTAPNITIITGITVG